MGARRVQAETQDMGQKGRGLKFCAQLLLFTGAPCGRLLLTDKEKRTMLCEECHKGKTR